jgi:hypothetical protein
LKQTSLDAQEAVLELLPSSGRLPCRSNVMDVAARMNFGGKDPQDDALLKYPGLYDAERLPKSVLFLLAASRQSSEFRKTVATEGMEGLPSLFWGHQLFGPLHSCGFDRTLWQLGEAANGEAFRVARRHTAYMNSLSPAAQQEFLVTEESSTDAWLNYMRRMKALAATASSATFAKEVPELRTLEEQSRRWAQARADLFDASESEVSQLPKLIQIGAALDPGTVWCGLFASLNDREDWYSFAIYKQPSAAEPVVIIDRTRLPGLLLAKLTRILYDSSSSETEAVLLGRRMFERIFPGELGRVITQSKNLIITPSGRAWSVPFAALAYDSDGTNQFLGLTKPFTLMPSVDFWQATAEKRDLPKGPPVIVSGLSYATEPQRRVTTRFDVGDLLELPHNAKAGNEIAALYRAVRRDKNSATEGWFIQALSNAPLVHVATHGYAPLVPGRSYSMREALTSFRSGMPGIWLSSQTNSGLSNDGLLQAREISQRVVCNADLVVLAACEVASGRSLFAATPELPAAFLYAGARSVVAPITKVQDEPTAQLCLEFHRRIKAGERKDSALTAARKQVAEMSAFKHPAHWASFLLFGAADNRLSQ